MKKRALSGILLVMGAVILAGCGSVATVPGGRAAGRQNLPQSRLPFDSAGGIRFGLIRRKHGARQAGIIRAGRYC